VPVIGEDGTWLNSWFASNSTERERKIEGVVEAPIICATVMICREPNVEKHDSEIFG
jgi:hypothetical protein